MTDMNQKNIMKIPEIKYHIYIQFLFNKNAKAF